MVKIDDKILDIDFSKHEDYVSNRKVKSSEWVQVFALLARPNIKNDRRLESASIEDLKMILEGVKSIKNLIEESNLENCVTCDSHGEPLQWDSSFSKIYREQPKIVIHSELGRFDYGGFSSLQISKVYCNKCLPNNPQEILDDLKHSSDLPTHDPDDIIVVDLSEKITPILHYRPPDGFNEELYRKI